MTEPLAVLRLKHAVLEVWPDNVCTVFPDGARVPAAPNGDETLLDTALHEASHLIIAELRHDRASVCLRAQADGDGRRWTDERRAEEDEAFALGQMLAGLLRAVW